jgi:fibronectin-binding autotransporter adhesin
MGRTGNCICAALGFVLAVIALDGRWANAQSNWTGTNSSLWSDAGNWTPSAPPNNGTDQIVFSGSHTSTSTIDTNWNVNTITYNADAISYLLNNTGGAALTMQGGFVDNSPNKQVVTVPITLGTMLGATQTWTVNTGAELDVNGTISGADTTFTKAGAGILQLGSGANGAFATTINVTAGTMRQSVANALPDTDYNVNGGILDFNGLGGTVGTVRLSSGNVNLSGGNVTFDAITGMTGDTGVFSTGTGGTATVNGALTLNGSVLFSVDGGTATVGDLAGTSTTASLNLGSGTFTDSITSGADTFAGTILSTAGGKFILNGASGSTLTLTGTNNSTSTFVAGTMQINAGNTLIAGADNSLPTADYNFLGNGALHAQGHNFAVTSLTDDGAGTASIDLGSANMTIQNATGTPVYTGTITGATNGSNVPTITMSSGTQTLSGVISGDTQVIANGGTLTLGNVANTYTGGTTLNTDGTVSISSDGNLGATSGALTMNGGTLEVTGTTDNALNPARTFNFGALGGTFQIDDAGNTFTVSQNLSGTGTIQNGRRHNDFVRNQHLYRRYECYQRHSSGNHDQFARGDQ